MPTLVQEMGSLLSLAVGTWLGWRSSLPLLSHSLALPLPQSVSLSLPVLSHSLPPTVSLSLPLLAHSLALVIASNILPKRMRDLSSEMRR
jgi:hypothetical protein